MWTWTMNQRCDEYGETDDEEAGERRRPRKTIKSPKLVPEWCDKCNKLFPSIFKFEKHLAKRRCPSFDKRCIGCNEPTDI